MKPNCKGNTRHKRIFTCLLSTLFILLFILLSCSLQPQWQFTFSDPPINEGEKSNLIMNISSGLEPKTLLPDIDMNPFSYDIAGSGPNGTSFNETAEQSTVEIFSLDPGDWTFTVNAKNLEGTVISMGKDSITLEPGNTKTLNILVTPIEGHGTLDITVYWTSGEVNNPSIEAQLTPASGSPIGLSFTIGLDSATCVNDTVPTGYHTLVVELFDNGILVMGAVEVVRIVNEQITSGVFEFFDINQPGGDIAVNITPELNDPIDVTMNGQLTEVLLGESMTVSASVPPETGNVVYVWYINGESKQTGASYTVGSEFPVGVYRLDLTAFTADGKRAGSTSHTFNVIEPAQVTLTWDPNSEPDLAGYKLYYGDSSGNYTNVIDVGNEIVCTVNDLLPGETYYFTATAYNTQGFESDYSNEVVYTVPSS
jgi:hypothetical protein